MTKDTIRSFGLLLALLLGCSGTPANSDPNASADTDTSAGDVTVEDAQLDVFADSDASAADSPVEDAPPAGFAITDHADADFSAFPKRVIVFGIPIYAAVGVEDEKILHAAALMAEYLDNDEDGVVDNELVLSAMNESRAFLVMWKRESDLDFEPPDGRIGQDLGADETRPSWHNGVGEFDAGLEEVLHLVTHAGYAQAYPEIFGERAGTPLCDAMDIARGGRFESVPDTYPDEAWYTYDDRTCDYSCMSTEYIYWALTSLLGAQERREDEIGHEWRLHTPELLTETDLAVSVLLTDPDYKFPTVLPDGIYR